MTALLQKLRCFPDKILLRRDMIRQLPVHGKINAGLGSLLDRQLIVQVDRLHQHAKVVIAVLTSPGHIERQIDLGRCLYGNRIVCHQKHSPFRQCHVVFGKAMRK